MRASFAFSVREQRLAGYMPGLEGMGNSADIRTEKLNPEAKKLVDAAAKPIQDAYDKNQGGLQTALDKLQADVRKTQPNANMDEVTNQLYPKLNLPAGMSVSYFPEPADRLVLFEATKTVLPSSRTAMVLEKMKQVLKKRQ